MTPRSRHSSQLCTGLCVCAQCDTVIGRSMLNQRIQLVSVCLCYRMFHVAGDLYIYSRGNYVNEQSEWNNLVTYIVYCVAVLWTGSSRVFGICCHCERGKDVSFFTHLPIHFCLFVGLLFTHCLIPVLMKCTSICSTNELIGSKNTDPCVDKETLYGQERN